MGLKGSKPSRSAGSTRFARSGPGALIMFNF